jgi:hypothetical protein
LKLFINAINGGDLKTRVSVISNASLPSQIHTSVSFEFQHIPIINHLPPLHTVEDFLAMKKHA